MQVGPIVVVILLAILVMCFFRSGSSKMNSYYAPPSSSCSCNKRQTQGVYMPDMNAFPDSSKPDRTYNYKY